MATMAALPLGLKIANRVDGAKPRATSALATRLARVHASAYVTAPASSTSASRAPAMRSSRSKRSM
jgi:hypothetical protein